MEDLFSICIFFRIYGNFFRVEENKSLIFWCEIFESNVARCFCLGYVVAGFLLHSGPRYMRHGPIWVWAPWCLSFPSGVLVLYRQHFLVLASAPLVTYLRASCLPRLCSQSTSEQDTCKSCSDYVCLFDVYGIRFDSTPRRGTREETRGWSSKQQRKANSSSFFGSFLLGWASH